MIILVGCEESQSVTIILRALGYEAYSCDVLPCSGDHPEWHLQMDIFEAIRSRQWDLIICFPPCTDLALSGAKHFEKKRIDGRQEKSIQFFFNLWKLSDCCENPMGIMNGGGYIKKWFPELHKEMHDAGFQFKPTQIIQPWQFGDEAQKTTCLWLKGLPLLMHTGIVDRGAFYTSPQGKKLPKWYNDNKNSKARSKTFPGIAKAMAEQWTDHLMIYEEAKQF